MTCYNKTLSVVHFGIVFLFRLCLFSVSRAHIEEHGAVAGQVGRHQKLRGLCLLSNPAWSLAPTHVF